MSQTAGDMACYVFNGSGAVQCTPPEQAQTSAARGFRFVLFKGEWPDEQDMLDPGLWHALTGGDGRPRCEIIGDGAILVLHTFKQSPASADAEPSVARFYVEKGLIVALMDAEATALFGLDTILAGQRPARTPAELLGRLALRAANRAEPLVDQLDEKLDVIEAALGQNESSPRVRLGAIRRGAVVLRRHVLPQRDALSTLVIEDAPWIHEHDRARLREAVAWMARLHAELETISERANLIREQLVDRRAEQTNRAMLVLASVTTIFMPLTLLTGILGMNVEGIPFAHAPWAFWGVAVVMVVIGALVLLWLKARRWI